MIKCVQFARDRLLITRIDEVDPRRASYMQSRLEKDSKSHRNEAQWNKRSDSAEAKADLIRGG